MITTSQKPKTYLQIASFWGLFIGIACCVAIFSSCFSLYNPTIFILAIIAYVAVPVIAWRMLSSVMSATQGTAPLATLWRTGTVAFAAGGLILSLAVLIYFKWIDPDLITRMCEDVIKMYNSLGTSEAIEKANELKYVYESTGLPSPAEMAMQFFTFTFLSGTVLSLIYAAILSRRANRYRNTPPPLQ